MLEKDFGQHQTLDFLKNQLTEEVYSTLQNQQECLRITNLVNSGDYAAFIQSKSDLKVHPEEYSKFCAFVARFPIIGNVFISECKIFVSLFRCFGCGELSISKL